MNDMAAPKTAPVPEASGALLQLIPLAQLVESPINARRIFDPEKLKELADSIRQKGILTPLLVRPRNVQPPNFTPRLATPTDDRYEILAGARRSRAAKLAGLAAAPCIVRDVDDATAVEIITIENLQREDLSELEEAEGFQRILKLRKCSVEQLADRLGKNGKSVKYVYDRLKLLELMPAARQYLAEGKITAGHGILIARLPADQQLQYAKRAARKDYDGGTLSVRRLAETIQWDAEQKKRAEQAKEDAAKRAANPQPERSVYKRPAAELAKERKRCAVEQARIEALRQIADRVKTWDLRDAVRRLAERTTFDSQKLACRVLGVWPADGKVTKFDFRRKLQKFIEAVKSDRDLHRIMAVLSLLPDYGHWSSQGFGGSKDIAALHAAGKRLRVNVGAIEREFTRRVTAKAKPKGKAPKPRKLQTSAHSAGRKAKRAKGAKGAK